jgi:hypothetical protein
MTRLIQRIAQTQLLFGLVVLLLGLGAMPVQAEESSEPKSIRKTCGTCPEGYATTGVTESKEICKDGDPTLVQCAPLGANLLSVCGSCPEGYREIGNSFRLAVEIRMGGGSRNVSWRRWNRTFRIRPKAVRPARRTAGV